MAIREGRRGREREKERREESLSWVTKKWGEAWAGRRAAKRKVRSISRGNVTIFEHCRGRPLKRLRCEERSIRSREEMSSITRWKR